MIATSPLLLAVDTSSRWMGLAIFDGAQVLYEAVWTNEFGKAPEPAHHTVELAPAVAEALERCGLKPENLGAVAAALGPGSFTGLRIGLALVKGLAIARSLPVIGVPSLDALAHACPTPAVDIQERGGPVASLAAVLRAGRGRLAVGWYQAGPPGKAALFGGGDLASCWRPATPHGTPEPRDNRPYIEVLTAEELAARIQQPTLVCGELSAEERSLLRRKQPLAQLASPAHSLRRPGFLAELAWQRWKTGQTDDPASLAPIYLHYDNQAGPG